MDRHLYQRNRSLLDGEVGFGTSPLKTHIRKCPTCRGELEEARATVRALEHLRISHRHRSLPSGCCPGEHLRSWHVAVLDTLRGWFLVAWWTRRVRARRRLPAAVMSVLGLWIALRFDAVVFAVVMLADRVRAGILDAAGTLLAGALGESGTPRALERAPRAERADAGARRGGPSRGDVASHIAVNRRR